MVNTNNNHHLSNLSEIRKHPDIHYMTTENSSRTSYFTNFTVPKAYLYGCATTYVAVVAVLSLSQPWMFDVCKSETESLNLDFENPGYDQRICIHSRSPMLLYLTPEECSFGRRILFSAGLGAAIGWERRGADRPAGIRTMSLVSLGACLFSICSAYAFLDGPMNWDGSTCRLCVIYSMREILSK